MDKRYILILIIIIICLANLSIIVNNSDVVGSATATAGKYLFSVPHGFSLFEKHSNSAFIRNNDDMSIYYQSDLNNSDTYDKRLSYLDNESDDKILSKGSFNLDNISVDTVYYQTINNTNKSAFYFEKNNTQFKIIMSNFNYNTDRNLTLEYATIIIRSTHYDYKLGY